jgi:regulator of protease activity HflC (stomatin/prohibitin superfamily)
MNKEEKESLSFFIFGGLSVVLTTVALIWGLCASNRLYSVWAERKAGEAELARAESNRQIKTLEAKAVMESSKHLADAEIVRARGVAEANKIIGDSLKGNESYLRYLWIHGLSEGKNQVIYVPTEANLPILEAGKGR